MKRRISATMMVSGTILLLISVLFSTVSFAAPDLGRASSAPQAPRAQDGVCEAPSPKICLGVPWGSEVTDDNGKCWLCLKDTGGTHCHKHPCEGAECTSGATRYCDTGLPGVCADGTETCVEGQWSGVCEQDMDSSPEVCDGLDNNCDGQVDEGGVCDECTTGETRPCDTGQPGVCADGTETCVAGEWSGICEQNTQSSDEVCNGLDDDCDGSVDEDLGTTTCGVGECEVTVDNCAGGVPQACVPGEPGEEVCNALDDDCDGQVDEDLGTTTCGMGVCQVTVDNCVDGVLQECVPGEPSDEICGDGLDNDCDGQTDEGCECDPGEEQACYPGPEGTEGVGLCQAGTQTCDENGQWGECVGAIVPTDEICDLLDNDCDGSVDEGLGTTTCGVGECEVTVDNCVDGEPQECTPGDPTDEICDGKDNDCDGKVDEGGVCGTPPPQEGPEPEPEATPTPTPTPMVEVLGVESLPTAGIMPVGPALPILPMIFSSLTLIGGGLLLWGEEDE
jgi:hypothetical protein